MERKIRFGIVGSGWRSLCYVRTVLALPERFEMCGILCRTEEKVQKIHREYGIPVFTDPEEFAGEHPEFIVCAVDKAHVLEVSCQWLERGYAVLAETPAAVDRASLQRLMEIADGDRRLVAAEQYRLFPDNTARIRLAESGMLGDPSYLYLSLAHEYHAASLMRAMLQISPETPYTVQAYARSWPTAETMTRYECIADGRIALKKRTIALITFENGRTCLYDFDSEQYRSPIRSSHWKLQGTRGEIFDDTVLWLDETNTPCRSRIRTVSREVHTDSQNPNLSLYETIEKISFQDEILYLPDTGTAGLSQDDTAIAQMLVKMASYVRGEGEAPYSLRESIADALFAIVPQEAVCSGRCVHSQAVTER